MILEIYKNLMRDAETIYRDHLKKNDDFCKVVLQLRLTSLYYGKSKLEHKLLCSNFDPSISYYENYVMDVRNILFDKLEIDLEKLRKTIGKEICS